MQIGNLQVYEYSTCVLRKDVVKRLKKQPYSHIVLTEQMFTTREVTCIVERKMHR